MSQQDFSNQHFSQGLDQVIKNYDKQENEHGVKVGDQVKIPYMDDSWTLQKQRWKDSFTRLKDSKRLLSLKFEKQTFN